MPIKTQHAAECLEPVGVGKSLQHLVRTKIGYDNNRDFPGEFDHTLKKPGRCFAAMEGKIGDTCMSRTGRGCHSGSPINCDKCCNCCCRSWHNRRRHRQSERLFRIHYWIGMRTATKPCSPCACISGSRPAHLICSSGALTQTLFYNRGKHIHKSAYRVSTYSLMIPSYRVNFLNSAPT